MRINNMILVMKTHRQNRRMRELATQTASGNNKPSMDGMDAQARGPAKANGERTGGIANEWDVCSDVSITDTAINLVSTERAKLSALQSGPHHKVVRFHGRDEPSCVLESRISDLDQAKEMSSFTHNNILVQAHTATLAQANASAQSVLNLLR